MLVCSEGCGWYQVIDCLAAKSADQVQRKLDDEDHQDEGRHVGRANTAVCWAANVSGIRVAGMLAGVCEC